MYLLLNALHWPIYSCYVTWQKLSSVQDCCLFEKTFPDSALCCIVVQPFRLETALKRSSASVVLKYSLVLHAPELRSKCDVICGLSLLLVHASAMELFKRVLRVFPLLIYQYFQIQFNQECKMKTATWVWHH